MVDGDTVAEGETTVTWAIRVFKDNEGNAVIYDWIADNADGSYTESDEYFFSIEEAKADLGV